MDAQANVERNWMDKRGVEGTWKDKHGVEGKRRKSPAYFKWKALSDLYRMYEEIKA